MKQPKIIIDCVRASGTFGSAMTDRLQLSRPPETFGLSALLSLHLVGRLLFVEVRP